MDTIKTIQHLTEELLHAMAIEAEVSVVTDETEAYRIHIDTDETGLLIGHHGRTLESLQILLGIMISRTIGTWVKVYVNVGDYREKREETLHYMAQRAAEQAITTRTTVELARLTPSERRIVHLALTGDDRVVTESEGEGDRRILKVIPKPSSL